MSVRLHANAIELLNGNGLAAALDLSNIERAEDLRPNASMYLVNLEDEKFSNGNWIYKWDREKNNKHKHAYLRPRAHYLEYMAHCIRLHSPS